MKPDFFIFSSSLEVEGNIFCFKPYNYQIKTKRNIRCHLPTPISQFLNTKYIYHVKQYYIVFLFKVLKFYFSGVRPDFPYTSLSLPCIVHCCDQLSFKSCLNPDKWMMNSALKT